jgi:hypothetical protein
LDRTTHDAWRINTFSCIVQPMTHEESILLVVLYAP